MNLVFKTTMMVAAAVISLSSQSLLATDFKAADLVRKVQQSNSTWEAAENQLSTKSVEELKRMMGYRGQVNTDVTFTDVEENASAGNIVDWRNKDGQNWVSPVLDQGNCGSCVAFAAIGTLETQINISRNLSWLNPKLSTQALFACGGGSCDSGWYPTSAVRYIKNKGVPDEACFPYLSGATGEDVSCKSLCADSSSRSEKISDSSALNGAASVKKALDKGPVITTMQVYDDFVVYKSGIYKHGKGSALGGHAVSIVGYNDVDRYWIIRNSWSQDWGENGFANVSYDDVSGVGGAGWSMVIPNKAGVVGFKNLADRDYQAGTFSISAESTLPGTTQLSLQINDGKETHGYICAGASCDFTIESSKLPDGQYHAVIIAKAGTTELGRSEPRFFYVLNSTPNATLSYSAKGFDLNKPIANRVEFEVDAQSSPVPFTELEFIVTQNGKTYRDHVSKNVAPQTVMGWRTGTVPNGTYQIQLLGKTIVGDQTYTTDGGTYTVTVKNR